VIDDGHLFLVTSASQSAAMIAESRADRRV